VRLAKLVRGELDWIAMKCLEKDPCRRYETANGLARDVERYLADESVEACPPSAMYRLFKFVRRNWASVVAASIIFLLLLGGSVGTTWGFIKADQALKKAADLAESGKKANAQAQKRLQQIERGSVFLESVFRDLDPRAEEKEGMPLRAILGDRIAMMAEQIEGEAVGDPLLTAHLQYRLGLTLLHLHIPRRAIPLFERTLAVRTRILGPEHRDTLSSMGALAEAYSAAGDDKALPLFERTLKLRKSILGADDTDTLFSMSSLAGGYKAAGKLELAVPLLEETLELRKVKLGADHPETLNSMNNLASCYMAASKLNLALPLLEQTLELRKAKLGANHTDTLNSMNSLADCYRRARRLDKALPLLEQTLELRKAALGADNPDTLISMNNLAAGHMDNGSIELALPLLEATVRLSKARRGLDNPYTLGSMNNLAWTYRTIGSTEKALQVFLEAATVIEKRGFRDEFADGIVANLVGTQERLKQFGAAEAWRRKWVRVVKARAGPDSLLYAGELGALGANLIRQEKWADAEQCLREAVAILEKKASASLAKFNVKSLLGSVLLEQKRYAQAEPLLVEGYEGIKARESQIGAADQYRVVESGDEVIRLYDRWGQVEKAALWRTKVRHSEETEHKR
jgi:eukaryotic-like serine/threonine-protein kinase